MSKKYEHCPSSHGFNFFRCLYIRWDASFNKEKWSQNSVLAITAMSVGVLLSISILDLIPDNQEQLNNNI
jgi:hypothetical protein